MSKIFSVYSKNKDGIDVDRVWFESSNIKYTECLDNNNELKTLKVVFNNGTQYQYNKVDVGKYLLFREDLSQGKALNKYIKGEGYEYEKLDNADLDAINWELEFRLNGGFFVSYDGREFTLKDNKDEILCGKEVKLTKDAFDTICAVLTAVGKEIYVEGENFIDENNEEYSSAEPNIPF